MATVGLTPEALDDLERLADFLRAASPQHARRIMGEVLDGFSVLSTHPRVGRPAAHGLRELVLSVGKAGYVALYRFKEASDSVLVLRVRHQREAGYRNL